MFSPRDRAGYLALDFPVVIREPVLHASENSLLDRIGKLPRNLLNAQFDSSLHSRARLPSAEYSLYIPGASGKLAPLSQSLPSLV